MSRSHRKGGDTISNPNGTDLKKWTYTFGEDDDEKDQTYPSPFAAVHGLATKDIIVGLRNKDGSGQTGNLKTIAQDSNLALIHSGAGYFYKGQTIIIIG